MQPSAPYFSHLSLFAEGGTLIDMLEFLCLAAFGNQTPDLRQTREAYGPFPLIKEDRPRGLPVWDGSVKQCSLSVFCTKWRHLLRSYSSQYAIFKNTVCLIHITVTSMPMKWQWLQLWSHKTSIPSHSCWTFWCQLLSGQIPTLRGSYSAFLAIYEARMLKNCNSANTMRREQPHPAKSGN